ncbi:hypothetical protein [Halomonas ventosae]|uniref:Uncharacterized protein n=1 Tax=Halomonas ventosae TaxID=229007 RepID=A0A2T0VA85_9GAMM|nr:hypothetical protein [Halomonas ventosae]PRY67106.1 hypothetical protein BCL64_12317 [Halomonas ventosae]
MDNVNLRWGAAPLATLALFTMALLAAPPALANDYPTETRVDYVLGCMAANGQDHLMMQKCSCSIDVIAELMPHEDYEAARTVMSMQDQPGELGMLFRTERSMQEDLNHFRSVQAEADLRCF